MEILNTLGINPQAVLIAIVGFVILLTVLSKFAFGPLLTVLQARQDKIRGDLDQAEASRKEMLRLQDDYQKRLAQIEDEARDKIQTAVREAQSAREELLTKARDEAANIVARAQEEVAAERSKALVEARNQIVDLASLMATRTVGQSLNASSHAQLIDETIAALQRN